MTVGLPHSMINHTFVDLDGVLANFNLKAAEIFGLPYPTRSVTDWGWLGEQRPDLKRSGFYEEMDRHPTFYQELPLYPWHSRLVTLLDLHTPGWTILTGCIKSPHAWAGW